MQEKRKHVRLPLTLDVELRLSANGNGTTYKGITRNISFGGVLIDFAEPPGITAGEACAITIVLHEGDDPILIELEAQVMHKGEIGMGLKFLKFYSLDIESYRHFKNLMVLNSPDPEKLLDELYKNPGLLPVE